MCKSLRGCSVNAQLYIINYNSTKAKGEDICEIRTPAASKMRKVNSGKKMARTNTKTKARMAGTRDDSRADGDIEEIISAITRIHKCRADVVE